MTAKELMEILRQTQMSHSWLLKGIKRCSDETSGGNYSDELKHAIAVQELLDKVVE